MKVTNIKIGNQTVDIGHFNLHLKDNNTKARCVDFSKTKLNGNGIVNFSDPFTKGHPMIYIVKKNDEIIYVGYTHDSLTNRLYGGLCPGTYNKETKERNLGKNGYAGYKWRFFDEVDLYVFVFSGVDIKKVKNGEEDKKIKHEHRSYVYMFENIEAELVFQLKMQGNWPKYQSEIHFYCDIKDKQIEQIPKECVDEIGISATKVAEQILNKIK